MLSTAFCVALLAATAVAFALTEGAKTELSPLYGTKIAKVFSPVCNPALCRSHTARIDFKVRERQRLEVWVQRNGRRVATVVAGKRFPKGEVNLAFRGLADDGVSILPDGKYQPVVRFVDEHRTITLPNLIRLDTAPPEPARPARVLRAHISPDGDGRYDTIRIPYALSTAGHAVLLVNGRQAVFTRTQRPRGSISWNGRLHGRLLAPGHYRLAVAGQDAAGNRSAPAVVARVEVRYLRLGRPVVHVVRRHRFALFVLTDARSVSWLLDRGRGVSRSHTLRIRAPRKPGDYSLYVTAAGHTAKTSVVVTRRRAAP
jgi:hypothetical protein